MKKSNDLIDIPGVGKKTKSDLIRLGYPDVNSLIGKDPEDIYTRDAISRGGQLDRCQLYVYRCAVYYANNDKYDPEKLKWWYWKD